MLSLFPHLTASEFGQACESLTNAFSKIANQCEWLSVQHSDQNGTAFLRISTVLPTKAAPTVTQELEHEMDEVEEHDDEAMKVPEHMQPLVNYDIVLSPSYQVPVLYISISDPEHRFPPTMATLQEHLLEPTSKDQTEHFGPMGGVTITDHPATNTPVFFIHPCQTPEVMEAAAGDKDLSPEQYLFLWLGAFGQHIGLRLPLALSKALYDERS